MKSPVYTLSLVLLLLATPVHTLAQSSDAPIKLVVPFGAGSSVDATARPLGRALQEAAKKPVIIENRAGAEGLIGAKAVMTAQPDGTTVMFTSNSVPTLLPVLKKVPPFDPSTDFVAVCSVAKAPMNVFIRSSLPFKTLSEFVAAAKANPEKYTFAYSTGLNRLGAEWFQQLAGIKLRGIGYKATAQALVDILAGEVDLIVADASTALVHYKSGKLRPLVVADSQRTASVPDAPSAPEAGMKGFSVSVWMALYLPPRTAKDVASKWQQLVKSAAADPSVRDANQLGGRDEMILCGDDLVQYQRAEIAHWRNVIDKAKIELE